MKKLRSCVTGFVAAVVCGAAAAVVCSGCNDGGVESDGGDAAAYLNMFKGSADGVSSDYVVLGGNNWMKKNLNVETADSRCFLDRPDNCEKYGRLYTWEAAKSACQQIGFRLPFKSEWDALIFAAGGEERAGNSLKATSGWYSVYNSSIPDDNGTDNYGFSALPGGIVLENGSFAGEGTHGYWWTASKVEGDNTNAYALILTSELYSEHRSLHCCWRESVRERYSVRCVKD